MGTVLLIFGILMWVMTATLPFSAYYARLVLRGHIELLSIGVVSRVRQVQQFGHGGWVVLVEKLLRQSRP